MTKSPTIPQSTLPGALCLFGLFIHILLSDPLLGALGFHYSGETGSFYEKIHPGTWFIAAGFAALLLQRSNPLQELYVLGREQTASLALLIVCMVCFMYIVARSGVGGSTFMIETHMLPPICVLILCTTPAPLCRRALHLFIAIALLNSGIGIAEAVGKFRLFTFDPHWTVLHETYFRSSALLGHPLNNAMFTAIALCVVLAMDYRGWLKALLTVLMLVSLVAFGGRAALLFSTIAVLLRGASMLRRNMLSHKLMLLTAPILLIGGLVVVIQSPIGARIAAHGLWDASAHSRFLAPIVLDFMKPEEMIFGVSMDRIMEITARVNQVVPISYIENPWLLMFMALGAVMFPLWLAATLAFARRLLRGQSLAGQLTVWAYFITASTSNSFGRKDSVYLIMACVVTCLAQIRKASSRRWLRNERTCG